MARSTNVPAPQEVDAAGNNQFRQPGPYASYVAALVAGPISRSEIAGNLSDKFSKKKKKKKKKQQDKEKFPAPEDGHTEQISPVPEGGCNEQKPPVPEEGCYEKNLSVPEGRCSEQEPPVPEGGCNEQDVLFPEAGCNEKETLVLEGQCNEQEVPFPEGGYNLPLVWIDLEMTGLNVEVDRILEIACVITDDQLTQSKEGPDIVIHQTQECLDQMGEWCQCHHGASGLIRKVQQSNVTEQEAENQVMEFLKRYVGTSKPSLAGNSVYTDYIFLKKYMPNLASMFSHVLVDVSTIMALCIRWYRRAYWNAPPKLNRHRAMDDIRESIRELKYYRKSIFKAPDSDRC